MVSCLLGSSRLLPGLPPSYLWHINPLQAVFMQPMQGSVLSLGLTSKAQASATSPTHPSVWADKPLRLLSAGLHWSSVWESVLFALCTPVAVLSSVALKLPPPPPISTNEGAPYCVETFPPSQLPPRWAGPVPILLSLFFLLPYPGSGDFLALGEVWSLLPVFSRSSVGFVTHVDIFLVYLWGGRWCPRLTPPPSLRSSSQTF